MFDNEEIFHAFGMPTEHENDYVAYIDLSYSNKFDLKLARVVIIVQTNSIILK